MSQKKEKSGTSGMQPPPASIMQQHPSAMMARAPWSVSRVPYGQSMMNMPPFYHMIHVPSPLAIVNTHPMFVQQPPNVQHHGGDGAVSSCTVAGCQALPAPTTDHICCKDNPEMTKMTASCKANGSYDVAFIKFQKNAQLHGIKISSTTEKLERSGSSASGRLSVASPVFTPHGVVSASGKTFALPEGHLPGVLVVSSDEDEDDQKGEDTINSPNYNEKHEQQATGGPMMVNGADSHADFSENCLSSESQEVKAQLPQFASGMQLNSDEGAFFVGGCLCGKHREMMSTYTQTEMTILETVIPQVFDKCTSTEDLKELYDQGTNTEFTSAGASATQRNDLKQSRSKKEKSEVSADDCVCCSVKDSSLETIDDSATEEEMDLPTERRFPAITDKPKTNSLTSETFLLAVKRNPRHQPSDVREKSERQSLTGKSKANFLTSVTSSLIDQKEQLDAPVHEPNRVRGELERWEKAEEFKASAVTHNTSSTIIKKERHDSSSHQPSDFRDEIRRRIIAAVEAVSDMCETEQVVSDADRATDSLTDNHMSTLTELNIKHPEVDQSRGPEDNSRRLQMLPGSVIYEDQALDGGASSTRQKSKIPPGPEEKNDLSNVLSRSGRSPVDNFSVIDNVSGQQNGPSSNHSGDSARQHKSCRADSRNVCREEAVRRFAGASVEETICSSKTSSLKGRDSTTHSENGTFKKASNSCLENVGVKESSNSLLDDGCSLNVMALADEESLSGSENMSVVMSVSAGELKSDCSSMANSISQIGMPEPSTEVMDMIKNHLLMCDPALLNNPQMLEALAVQQLYLMHQEQVVLSQMMEAMRQHQQPQLLSPQQLLLLPQHSAQPLLTPQQLLLQQHLVLQQQLPQPHLLPPQQFVMLPPTSKPKQTLPPRFAARLASQDNCCSEILPNVQSSVLENPLCAAGTNNSAFHLDTSVEDSELQKRSWQGCYSIPNHIQSKTVQSKDSAIKAMDYKQQEISFSYMTNPVADVKDSLPMSAVSGMSAVPSPVSHGKRASSVKSAASAAFPPNGACSESAVISPRASSRSAARAQLPASSPSVTSSGNGKPTEVSDCKRTDLYGHRKSFFSFGGNDTEVIPSVPLSSQTKPGTSSVLVSEKIGPAVPETAASKASDHSFGASGQSSSGGRGVRPKSVVTIGSVMDGASANGYLGSFQNREQSRDSVNFNKGEYEKDKLLEFKQSLDGPSTQGSASDQCAMGGDFVKNRKVFVPEKKVFCNRRMEGPFSSTSVRFQELDEDWGEDGSANWIKDPLHYGPPKSNGASRVRPKNEW